MNLLSGHNSGTAGPPSLETLSQETNDHLRIFIPFSPQNVQKQIEKNRIESGQM